MNYVTLNTFEIYIDKGNNNIIRIPICQWECAIAIELFKIIILKTPDLTACLIFFGEFNLNAFIKGLKIINVKKIKNIEDKFIDLTLVKCKKFTSNITVKYKKAETIKFLLLFP